MVPGGPVLRSFEFIGERIICSYRALGDAVNTVHVQCSVLPNSMPVNGGTIVFEVVRDFDLDVVTPASLDPRAWITIIEYFSLSIDETVRRQCHVSDIKLILAKSAFGSIHLIVCTDIEFFSIRFSEPAFSVLGSIALLPTNFARVVALKVAFGIGGSKYRPSVKDTN